MRGVAQLWRCPSSKLPVRYITTWANLLPDEMRNDFIGPGMDIVAKPFSIDILAARIRSLIDTGV